MFQPVNPFMMEEKREDIRTVKGAKDTSGLAPARLVVMNPASPQPNHR
jgi:hypothetical protein